ncbi:MAG: preprotein translocase subunit SecE [Hyphomicrobium sp.]|nr:preprotein translocase subunit SecE [Hyphomicrobium sp.]PPC80126.1 MAG: preprotein translocase subunit SecE [Hyphomicrobium sp.]
MTRFNPFVFVQEVREEVAKVTWPTWKEVWVTSVMVLIMVVLASLFFLLADQVIGQFVKALLGLGGANRTSARRTGRGRGRCPNRRIATDITAPRRRVRRKA